MITGPQGWRETEGLPARARMAVPMPPTVLWRWRYELGMTAGVALIWWSCAVAAGDLAALTFMTAGLALVAMVGPCRRSVVAAAWGVITPHRLRLACAQAGVVSPRGKLPAVLLTRRAPYGERVYLRCPSGLCARDVAVAGRAIAAICWASEVRVMAGVGQYPWLVVVDVVRQPERSEIERGVAEHRSGPSLRNRFDRHAARPSATPGPSTAPGTPTW